METSSLKLGHILHSLKVFVGFRLPADFLFDFLRILEFILNSKTLN